MEAPTPAIFKPIGFNEITPKFEIKKEKEYEIKYNNHKYNLKMKIDSNNIFFKLFEIKENDMIQICYKNKFDLKTITNMLMLHPSVYNDLDKVISLLGECYNLNKLSLTIDENNTKIIAKIMNGNIETECSINLIETKIEIEDKFDMILNDIKFLKSNMNTLVKNKLLGLETMLKDIQILTKQKLEENENKIKELSSKIEQYKCQFEKNKNNINLLQNDLNEIKQIKLLNKYLVGQVINDNINIDHQKDLIKSDKMDNNCENIATPLQRNIENLEKNEADTNEKKENSNNIEYIYSIKEGDINQSDDNVENNNSNHNKDLNNSRTPLNNNKNVIKKRTNFKNPKKFNKRGSMEVKIKDNFLLDKYSTETPQNNIIMEENDFDKEENIDKQNDLKGKYISDDDSDDSNNNSYYSLKDIRNQTATNIISIYSSTRPRLKSKNKIEHYKKKLSCIIEDINAPIPNNRKIPKIKIFKGFSKEIEKERKSY